MIKSMTGYGDAQGQLNGVTYVVEIRAVNNRYFKSSIHIPDLLSYLEDDIEKLLRANLSRGSVSYVLRLKDAPADVLFDIDDRALRVYIERLTRIASSVGSNCEINIAALLNLPGVIQPALPDKQLADEIKDFVLRITRQAIDKLIQMRAAEGEALVADLDKHCRAISDDIERIRPLTAVVVEQYRQKLRKRIDDLLANAKMKLDEATLTREVAVFAERSDIAEEISRLDSHLQQFDQNCRTEGQAGRRLDFITQEMLREANTIASKACDTEIANHIVNIKCRIDRIKEQVQNIE